MRAYKTKEKFESLDFFRLVEIRHYKELASVTHLTPSCPGATFLFYAAACSLGKHFVLQETFLQ